VTFGPALTIHVTAIGYMQPSLIIFRGQTEDWKPLELVQNVNVISFLLTALPRLDPDKLRRRIGFLRGDGQNGEVSVMKPTHCSPSMPHKRLVLRPLRVSIRAPTLSRLSNRLRKR
jgi:hypothetical protein